MNKLPPRDPREIGLFRYFVHQNVFVNLIYFSVFIVGVILWAFIMNREAFGNFDFDLVQVTTPYIGATAEEVEQLVTMPLENTLKTVEGIDEMYSISVEGISVITLKIDPDEGDSQKIIRTIEREVETVRTTDLPDDGDEPQVVEITAAFPVLTLGMSGNVTEMELRKLADDLEDDLLDIDGVSRVIKKGYKGKEVWVEADLNNLKTNHLSLMDLIQSIREGDHTSPGGRLDLKGEEVIVRTIGKLGTVSDVKRVVVRSNEEGKVVFVQDVAEVTERLERERKYTRFNGFKSIELDVLKKDSGDTLKIDSKIKELVDTYKSNTKLDVQFGYANEISFYINRRLEVLIKNGFVGIFLVLLIMFLFLKPQSALWSTVAIPFAFLGGLITMHFFGMTINLLSLFAFILVSGMLVDNGIVVAEYIERKREEGLHPFTAASVGISEMSIPVFASAITTIIAFAPLAFMEGITGKFLRQMPLVLIACLVADMLECLFILPAHLYHYDWKIWLPKFFIRIRAQAQRGLGWVQNKYQSILGFIVRRPLFNLIFFIPIFILLLIFSGFYTSKSFQMFPNVIDVFVIKFELPIGTTLKQTEKVAEGFEKIVYTLPKSEIDAVLTQVGSQGDRNRSNSGTHVGEIRTFLNKANPKRIPGDILIDQIQDEVKKYAEENGVSKFELEKLRGGPPVGRAIEVQIIGHDYTNITGLANEVKTFLTQQKGTIGITDDFDEGKKEIQLIINREAIARAGLTISQVSMTIRAAFDGQEAAEIKRVGATEDVKIRVKLKESDRETKATLDRLTIPNARGKLIPLKTLVHVEENRGLLTILRIDGNRTVTVTGDVDNENITSAQAMSKLKLFLDENMHKYPRTKYKFAGESKDQKESMLSLAKAIGIALLLIYMVLATLFRSYILPLIIMSVVVLAFIGTCLSLFVVQKPITLLVLIGFTGLTGVVVNNSILMIETYRRTKEQKNLSEDESIVEGSLDRLRPILLTSFSTFFGVLPLGLGIGGDEPFLKDMAFSFGCGLLFCSLLTLIWIPTLYASVIRIRKSVVSFLNK